jgi:hypothetical protein
VSGLIFVVMRARIINVRQFSDGQLIVVFEISIAVAFVTIQFFDMLMACFD